jgi:hypothetical protein
LSYWANWRAPDFTILGTCLAAGKWSTAILSGGPMPFLITEHHFHASCITGHPRSDFQFVANENVRLHCPGEAKCEIILPLTTHLGAAEPDSHTAFSDNARRQTHSLESIYCWSAAAQKSANFQNRFQTCHSRKTKGASGEVSEG